MLARHAALGPWSAAQRWSAGALLLAFAGWLTPPLAGLLDPDAGRFLEVRLQEGVVPLLAVAPLFLIAAGSGAERAPILELHDLRAIDWPTIMLFGGGLCLGDLMVQTGVASAFGALLAERVPGGGGLVLLAVGFAIVTSEFTSNLASATMVVPVAVAVAQQAGSDPLLPSLAATVACSFGFMLPVSTASNAMAYATGHVRQSDMIRAGIVLDLLGATLLGLWFGWLL